MPDSPASPNESTGDGGESEGPIRIRPVGLAIIGSMWWSSGAAQTGPVRAARDSESRALAPAPAVLGAWAQTTLTGQYALPFHAPYQGANSLESNAARETWDATIFLGARLWSGAELWVNPELDQGFGLSGTLGVAGCPSGEAYKVGANVPYVRMPRVFVRQTVNLGGPTQVLGADVNQFARTQTANRLVVTFGKFAVTDIFDANQYAHDPHADFLNWAIIDAGTFDYAADAWGYTYGLTLEGYDAPWVFRLAMFDLSIVPNSPTSIRPSASTNSSGKSSIATA